MAPRAAVSAGTQRVSPHLEGARRLPGWLIPVGLVSLHIVLALLVFDPSPHTGGDNAAYMTLAQSLLERGTYQELYDPALPPHTQYPPAFPVIIALATLIGFGSWVQLKLMIIAFSGLAVGATYLWLRRRSGPELALGVTIILAASPLVLDLAHWVLSDVPFWALTALALWGYGEVEGDQGSRLPVIVAIGATVIAYFTRSAGLPLALAAGVWLGWRGHRRELVYLAAVLLPLAFGWWLRARIYGGVDYLSQFWAIDPYTPELGRIGVWDLAIRVVENGGNYLTRHLPLLLVGRTDGIALGLGIGVVLAAITGWGNRVRSAGVAELFFPLYLGLILVWPSVWSGERFLLPIYPLFLAYAAEFVALGVRRVRPGWILPVGGAIVVGTLLLAIPALHSAIRHSTECVVGYRAGDRYPCLDPAAHDFFELAEWSRTALPEGSVVISRKPRLFYALSEQRGLIYPLSSDSEVFFEAVRESGARYLVLDQLSALTARYVGPILRAHPLAFCYLHSATEGYAAILGILPEGVASTDLGAEGATGITVFGDCPPSYLRLGLAE